jgi:hypothetical protein
MAKKIVLGVLGVLGLAVVGLVATAMMQPDTYRVERSRTIAVPASAVMPHLTDFRRWTEWNPWAELDPNMELTYSEPSSGQGAWYEWRGNDDVGRGKMTITGIADGRVRYDLEFIEPFASRADTELALASEGESTRVTWSMSGTNDFMSKIFCLFMDMDAMIGADFERGLENLNRAVAAGG